MGVIVRDYGGEYAHPELWDGCVGAWGLTNTRQPMGGDTLFDWSGRGNHGALTNMDPATDYVASGKGRELTFDGVDDYIAFSDPNITFPFSVSAWVRPNAIRGQCIWSYARSTTVADRCILVMRSTGKYAAISTSMVSGNFDTNGAHSTSTAAVGSLDHVVAVFASADERQIYVNGQLEGTKTNAVTPAAMNRMWAGRLSDSTPNWEFDGSIGNISVFKRALHPSDIRKLASHRGIAYERTPIEYPTVKRIKYPSLWRGCVGAWGLTNTRQPMGGDTLFDWSGANNHLTLTNVEPSDFVIEKRGKAIHFDTNEYGSRVFKRPVLRHSNNYTIACWFCPRTGAIENAIMAFDDNTSNSGNGIRVYRGASQGIIHSGHRRAGASSVVSSSSQATTVDVWHHVAVTCTDGGEASIYVDGKLVGSGTHSLLPTNPLDLKRVVINGLRPTVWSRNNSWDDARVYARVLSPYEIRKLASRRGAAYETEELPFWATQYGQDPATPPPSFNPYWAKHSTRHIGFSHSA